MGLTKEHLMNQEAKREVAEEIAIRVNLLERCDDHNYVFDPLNCNYEDAYKLANSLITNGDPLVDIFNGDRQELTDLIKDICDEYGRSCPGCDARNDD